MDINNSNTNNNSYSLLSLCVPIKLEFLCMNAMFNNKSTRKVAELGFEPRTLNTGKNEIRGLNQILL